MVRILSVCAGLCLALLILGGALQPREAAAKSEKTGAAKEEALQTSLYARLTTSHCLFHEAPSHTIVVEKVEGKKLRNLVILRKNDVGEIETLVQGREGELRVDPGCKTLSIRMRHGYTFARDGTYGAYFEERKLELPLKQ